MSEETRHTGYTQVIKQAFKGLDDAAVDMLRQFAVKKSYPPNTILCAEGDVADTFYLITGGRVIVTRNMEGDDQEFVLGFLGQNQYFGEMGLITDETRAATVTTLMDTDVLEITKDQFEQVFTSSPAMSRNILSAMIQIIRDTDMRAIEDLESRNAELAEAYQELEAAQADRIARAALEAQMEVAALAQRSLLPDLLPDVPGYQFAARFEPARHVGGDFYDMKLYDSGQVGMVVADVSDKGAHAALFMAVARTLFLTEARHYVAPVKVATSVHEGLLNASDYDMFVTALYGVLEPQTGMFRYVRAGHDEPLLIRANGDSEFIGGRGRFLGLWGHPAPIFEEQQVALNSGDVLLIYSDGVTDMRDAGGISFSREQLQNLVVPLRHYDADRIARTIYNAVQGHRGPVDAFDDFTLLVIRVE